MGSAIASARCRGGLVLFSDEVDPKCAESQTDFLWILAHLLNHGITLGTSPPEASEKRRTKKKEHFDAKHTGIPALTKGWLGWFSAGS